MIDRYSPKTLHIRTLLCISIIFIMCLGTLCACNNNNNTDNNNTRIESEILYYPLYGDFYSLQAAFDDEYLTHENLESIANLVNNSSSLNIDTMPPKSLEIVKALYASIYGVGSYAVNVKYYGEYNTCIAVEISSPSSDYPTLQSPIIIDNVTFIYPNCMDEVLLWVPIQLIQDDDDPVDGTFYSLQEAYDQGFLTKADLDAISKYRGALISDINTVTPKVINSVKQTYFDDIISTVYQSGDKMFPLCQHKRHSPY